MSIKVHLVDPRSGSKLFRVYPSVEHGGRLCVAVPAGEVFGVEVLVPLSTASRRFEYVVAVDGRDTLTNADASHSAKGVVTGRSYLCRGFRTGPDEVHEFVCTLLGSQATTGERNGTADRSGLVGVAVYAERPSPLLGQPWSLESLPPAHRGGAQPKTTILRTSSASRDAMAAAALMINMSEPGRSVVSCRSAFETVKGGDQDLAPQVSAGPSAGAAAGAAIVDRVTQTQWKRGDLLDVVVVEYDTPEGWAGRGVDFEPPTSLTRSPWVADEARYSDPSTL